MYGTSFLVFERTTGRFLGTTRPTAGDIAVFLPLTQADIDRKAAGGADVSQMEPHGAARSLHAIQNCPSNNTTPELVDLTSRFTHFLSPLRFFRLSHDGIDGIERRANKSHAIITWESCDGSGPPQTARDDHRQSRA